MKSFHSDVYFNSNPSGTTIVHNRLRKVLGDKLSYKHQLNFVLNEVKKIVGLLRKLHIFYLKQFTICKSFVNSIRDGHFGGCSGMGWGGGAKRPRLPKICDTYPTMMELGTVIPYLEKIRKTYESHETPSEFCYRHHFFTGNQQILLFQEIQI